VTARAVRVGLVFGGASVEHEVSVVSARGVREGLESGGLECVPIGVTEAGDWLSPELSEPILRDGRPRVETAGDGAESPRVQVDPGRGLVAVDARGRRDTLEVDAVFPLIHGWGGEDGRIQGLLELAGIAYVGSGLLGSAVGMDKAVSKTLLQHHGLPVGPWRAIRGEDHRRDPAGTLLGVRGDLRFPLFVKPANGGSSVGVSRVDDEGALPGAVEAALCHDDKVVVEAGLDAREIECAVLGNDDPQASVAGEIIPSREFYDYAAKYEDGTSELRIPAPIPPRVQEEIQRLSLEAFRVLELAGLARVDFFVERESNRILLNEVNTLPGFTPISMFPKLWEASGLDYPRMLQRLVRLGLERRDRQQERSTRRDR
jgi:D-alanine-D-alanine ligase